MPTEDPTVRRVAAVSRPDGTFVAVGHHDGPLGSPEGPAGRPGGAPVHPAMGPRVFAAAVAVVSAAMVWLLWRVCVDTAAGQHYERAALEGATTGQGTLWALAKPVLTVVSATYVIVGFVAVVAIALARRQWGSALAAAVLMIGANVSTQLLKHYVFTRPHLVDDYSGSNNTLPSGHTTVAAAMSAALLIVVPRRWRPWVAIGGGAYTAATGVSTLIGQWHRPSDVVAACFVTLAWTALVCALTPRSALDRPDEPSGWTAPAMLLLSLVTVGCAIVAVVAIAQGYPYGGYTSNRGEIAAYAGGACAAVAATGLLCVTALGLRQATGRAR